VSRGRAVVFRTREGKGVSGSTSPSDIEGGVLTEIGAGRGVVVGSWVVAGGGIGAGSRVVAGRGIVAGGSVVVVACLSFSRAIR
jgi:hypothetical protein